MDTIFWLSILLIGFAYFGYPASLVFFQGLFSSKNFRYDADSSHPPITLIIAAADEEKRIIQKLENCRELEYNGQINVIIGLDAPTDTTPELIKQWIYDYKPDPNKDIRFHYVISGEKLGKEGVQKVVVDDHARGSIYVFTDVATNLAPDTITQIVGNFADPRVGAVDGMSSSGGNEGLYLKYENKIRDLESDLGGLVTLGGCLFAVRSDIVSEYHELPNHTVIRGFISDMQSDFRTALVTKSAGKYAILDRQAIAEFPDTEDSKKEFSRKHRTIVRGMNTFFHHLYLLNPLNYGIFSYQYFAHKLLKWLVPFFMITAVVSNIWLSIVGSLWYYPVLALHATFYGYAYWGWKMPKTFNSPPYQIPAFFVMANLAILKAWYSYFIKRERFVSWTPTKRK